jgi:tetratricopeptide (TPR) repeat protein
MKNKRFEINLKFVFCILHFAFTALIFAGCGDIFTWVPRLGTGGRYLEGRDQFLRGRGGNMDTAIEALQVVVKDDPTYKDSMTLLGRAYYRKGHYDISRQVLERALLLNKDDEVAWLNLGLAQLKLGDDDAGMETLGGAITLVSKVSRSGYRNFPRWDSKGVVRTAISRAVVAYKKGLEEKDGIVRAVELILVRMDDEENFQKIDTSREWRRNQP